jgi:hypothetical protein
MSAVAAGVFIGAGGFGALLVAPGGVFAVAVALFLLVDGRVPIGGAALVSGAAVAGGENVAAVAWVSGAPITCC